MSLEDVDVTELNRILCAELAQWAMPGTLPRENEQGVEVLINNKGEGVILYRFVTWDRLLIEAEFSVPDLIRAGGQFVEDWLNDVAKSVGAERQERARHAPVHILSDRS